MLKYDDAVIVQMLNDRNHQYNTDLRERLLNFAVAILKILGTLPTAKENEVIKFQLSKSATSIGANYEEAQSSSYKEFAQKTRVALREANESKYWLRICQRLELVKKENIINLIAEAEEITKILGSIVSKVDKKLNS